MNNEIIKVQFDGDTLEGIPREGRAWVVVKRICEVLGVDSFTQARKLKTCPWATTSIMLAVAEDGKEREVFALDLDSLPMWLANIHASKVRLELREKLIRYQKECARVLRNHFFGTGDTANVELTKVLGGIMTAVVTMGASIADLAKAVADQGKRIEAVERKESSASAITRAEYLDFTKSVTDTAEIEFALGWHPMKKTVGTVRLAILKELSGVKDVEHSGRWARLSPGKYQKAMGWLEARLRAARRAFQKQSDDRQQEINFGAN